MQAALEALEDVDGTIMMLLGSIGELDPSDGSAGAKVRGAIASLRAALAQQEQSEPVALAKEEACSK